MSHNDHHHTPDDGELHPHVAPSNVMLGILILLLIMTGLTVFTALKIDLGIAGNLIVALVIAVFKAALVVGFFMHLHWDNKFNAIVLFFCLMAVATFMLFTIIDMRSRDLVDPIQGVTTAPTIAATAREKAALHDEGGHEPDAAEHESDNQDAAPEH